MRKEVYGVGGDFVVVCRTISNLGAQNPNTGEEHMEGSDLDTRDIG